MSERASTVQKLTEARATPRRSKMRPSTPMYLVGGAMLAAIFVVPLVWEILRSFEPSAAIVSPPSLKNFSDLGVANYTKLLQTDHILRNVENSLIVAVATAAVTAVVATLAGYGFGRFRFRGIRYHLRSRATRVHGAFPGRHRPALPRAERLPPFEHPSWLGGVLHGFQPPLRDLPDAQHLQGGTRTSSPTRQRSTALR